MLAFLLAPEAMIKTITFAGTLLTKMAIDRESYIVIKYLHFTSLTCTLSMTQLYVVSGKMWISHAKIAPLNVGKTTNSLHYWLSPQRCGPSPPQPIGHWSETCVTMCGTSIFTTTCWEWQTRSRAMIWSLLPTVSDAVSLSPAWLYTVRAPEPGHYLGWEKKVDLFGDQLKRSCRQRSCTPTWWIGTAEGKMTCLWRSSSGP